MSDDAETRGAPESVVVITGELDRRRAEALCLEIRALARECGIELAQLKVMSGSPPDPTADEVGGGT